MKTKLPDGREKKVSLSARRRQRFGRAEKHVFYDRFPPPRFHGDDRRVAAQHFEELTRVVLPKHTAAGEDRLAWDPRNLNDKMAVLYVDGNRFSEKQANLDAKGLSRWDGYLRSERAAFMNAFLDEAENDRTWFTRNKKGTYVIRMEVLMWGGDEFLFVLPAWHGWRAACDFFNMSKQWEFEGKPLTHSAGLVFCHHNAPIARVKRGAEELCALAKATGEPETNKLAYLTLESFDHVGLDRDRFFGGFLPPGCEPEDWVLSGDDLHAWQENVALLKAELPRTQVQRAAFAASRGKKPKLEELLARGEDTDGPDDTAPPQVRDFLQKLKSYKQRHKDLGHASPGISIRQAEALRAMHLSLLWDYVAPDLPKDRSVS
ncbi:MAG: hypothetical protein ACREYF_13450 [Gammaproteobacteria bacterium]